MRSKLTNNFRNFFSENNLNVVSIFMIAAVILGLYLSWEPVQISILLLIIWIILRGTNGQNVARWSLIFFLFMSVSILLKKYDLVEQFSLGAMIFLFFSVVKMSIDKVSDDKKKG